VSEEATPDEEALVASLSSARPEWQGTMAETLRTKTKPGKTTEPRASSLRGFFSLRRSTFAVAAMVLTIVAGWMGLQTLRPPSADQLLSQAYTERRTLELRIPGAKYAPMRVERSAGTSSMDKPSSLLRAEALIGENLQKTPNDPVWLQARARADLLDGNYESAIKSLQLALETQPDTPQLLIDLASAYFERAELSDQAIDYGNAIETLRQALSKVPDDPVALFNRAVVFQRMFLYREAIEDWEHYLRVDASSKWSEEARKRLAQAREKLGPHTGRENELTTDPAVFVSQIGAAGTSSVEQIQARADDYLELATRMWLPEMLAGSPVSDMNRGGSPTEAALFALASLTAQSHSDEWLTDMLRTAQSSNLGDAMRMLASAIVSDNAGRYDQGAHDAKQAEGLFRLAGSEPGALRARFERVYALDRSAKGAECLVASTSLVHALASRRYAWLQVQSLIEDATCRSVTGEMDTSSRETKQAIDVARAAAYRTLYLRALGNAASFASIAGDLSKAWTLNRNGLAEYWRGNYPPARAFQFYSELSYDAEGAEQPYAAFSAGREAVSTIIPLHNPSVEALARYRVASLAKAAGEDAEAVTQFEVASRMFARLPPTPTNTSYRIAGEIMRASLQARIGESDHSLALLVGARQFLPKISNWTVPLQFYQTLSTIHLQRGEYEDSVRALYSAISIGETAVSTMSSDHERLEWVNEVGNSYRDLVKIRFLHNQEPENALELWEWYRAMAVRSSVRAETHDAADAESAEKIDFARLDLGLEPHHQNLVAEILPTLTNVTVLSYAEGADGLLAWAFDNRGIRSRWVAVPKSELVRHIEHFEQQCSSPTSRLDALEREGHNLYGWLIEPFSDMLDPGRELVVEADDLIASVPFEALLDNSGNTMGSQFAITYSPGIGYMVRLRESKPFSPTLPTLVVGTPALDGGFGASLLPIPDATSEAQAVASDIANAHLLLGHEATIDAVQRSLPGVNIFHFAGHALSGRNRSGLLLASSSNADEPRKPALLNAVTLRKESLRSCQLVVLSACSTGKENFGNNNPDALVRALLRSGVPHVVASRWNIDSAATAELMKSFYGALFAGQSVAQALRQARVALMLQPNMTHPYYWAAFTAFGRPSK